MNEAADEKSEVAAPDLSGRELGDFRLLRRLGRGAMAEVYLAEQRSLKRQVAIKVLRSDLATDETYIQRFRREAQAAASLVHANIVQIHEVGHIDRVYFIAQEYVQGQNLGQWITRNASPDVRLAITIIRQVAAALAKAAEHGIVHRDIKPENIMLTRSGEVKVADFGLARLPRKGERVDLTEVGITLGTPLYMSPEQVEGKPLDPRSDIYSFGVTCYHMLAGVPPFRGETALSVAVQHVKKQPEPLQNARPDLPPALCRIVHKMLAKNPDDRFQSPRELLRELRPLGIEHLEDGWPEELPGWESAELGRTHAVAGEHTQKLGALMKTTPMSRNDRRWRWFLAAGCGIALVLGAALAFLTMREEPLLAQTEGRPSLVEQQPTAIRQYILATQLGTEESWRSVIEHFPEEHYLTRRAQQQLGRIHLLGGDYPQALDVFRKLAALEEAEGEFRAFGLAGQCATLTLMGKYEESAAILNQLWPIRSQLKDRQMQQALYHALRKNRSKLGANDTQQWRHWLSEQFPEDS